MTSFADPLSGISYTIKDHGFTDALSRAPGVVAYFGARALGMMFAKHRKETIAKAPSAGLKKLLKLFTRYDGFPKGTQEHTLLDKDSSAFSRIFQRFITSVPAVLAHETGATIRGKPNLLIPSKRIVPRGMNARSGRRKLAGLVKGETFVKRTSGGGALLFSRLGDGKALLLGLLRTHVTLKPQLKIIATWMALAAYREMRVQWALTQITQFLAGLPGEDARVNRLLPKTDTSRLLSQALGGRAA